MVSVTALNSASKFGVSVSLRSIIHSYAGVDMVQARILGKFPSPYGVSFILINQIIYYEHNNYHQVSVSLRSIIHSYQFV